jgi:hypothetical protein
MPVNQLAEIADRERQFEGVESAMIFYALSIRLASIPERVEESRYWLRLAAETPVLVRERVPVVQPNGAIALRSRYRGASGLPEALCYIEAGVRSDTQRSKYMCGL